MPSAGPLECAPWIAQLNELVPEPLTDLSFIRKLATGPKSFSIFESQMAKIDRHSESTVADPQDRVGVAGDDASSLAVLGSVQRHLVFA